MAEKRSRLVKADAMVTVAVAFAIWGCYFWCFAELSDAQMLGAIIAFLIDFGSLLLLTAAGLVLRFAWKRRSRRRILVGTVMQLLYGGIYCYLGTRDGGFQGFVTPGMWGSIPLLLLGVLGVALYLDILRNKRDCE